ncbi:hypothetical protein FZI85_23670 [Mycobacterium sp. CBMA293]|uniref:hypothetical protein n=2 Tax=Mycolicibacterium TaxID=1866885 RepID=UPI0012DF3864|nr:MULTISPECIES: hypothetical protein [unclassified Mycolicibacterium]MUL49642.1 hypothetical protein [Mycolicibacterium sp. CBMA 360]MUL60077.1 hypothetical protein [Mycolicibacterium sp. CBMA 335]MUL72864.1 hypothetical protein [Mycolicibacterium sp. CBMA 311]MUL96161.1 hypothetical protein [Mycolicibacterium sp. CBMA 230]MUM14015.1 hypothetical protein [Mycolicibacterium sp. CBMA 293]
MSTDVRSRASLPAVLLVAGAVAATPVVVPAVHQVAPTFSTVAVRPASMITDALLSLGDLVETGVNAAGVPVLALNYLPEYLIAGGVSALQNPSLTPSVLSYLVQTYLNPAAPSFAADLLLGIGSQLAGLLPYPLGPSGPTLGLIITDLQNTAITIGNLFTGLPSASAGSFAVQNFLGTTVPGQLLGAASAVVPSVLNAVTYAVSWAAHLPGNVEATVESAIRNPTQIPGLLSHLINGAVGPGGVVASIVFALAQPLADLPAPIGGPTGLVDNALTAFSGVLANLVGGLPVPVIPTPFAAVAPKVSGAAAITPKVTTHAPVSASAVVPKSASGVGSVPTGAVKTNTDRHSSHGVTTTAVGLTNPTHHK